MIIQLPPVVKQVARAESFFARPFPIDVQIARAAFFFTSEVPHARFGKDDLSARRNTFVYQRRARRADAEFSLRGTARNHSLRNRTTVSGERKMAGGGVLVRERAPVPNVSIKFKTFFTLPHSDGKCKIPRKNKEDFFEV